MAKSFTQNVKKKLPPNSPTKDQVEDLAKLAQKYVQNWTRTEAQKMIRDELVILPTKWGLQVGKYAVKNAGFMWHVYNIFEELVESFTCKQSAVTYCILEQTNRFNMAQELQRQDTRISKLEQDQTNYVRRRAAALKDKDSITVDMLEARLSESDSLLNLAREDLEKTLIKAKYLKGIWE